SCPDQCQELTRLSSARSIQLGPVVEHEMSLVGRYCSLIPGFGVKLSITLLAGSTVLSAVGSCPPHDGVRRRWWINVESAVALSSARQASSDLTTATVPAGTSFPACCRGNPVISFMRATREHSSST